MKKAILVLGILIGAAVSTPAHAATSDEYTVRGTVDNIDGNYVTLISRSGGKLRVPRRLVPENLRRPGATVEAPVSMSDLIAANMRDRRPGSNRK
jgi:hypothetical protein